METLLLIVSVFLIIMVLLRSNKASEAGQIISGGNSMLFAHTKERGSEKFITRFTYLLGFLFIFISLLLSI